MGVDIDVNCKPNMDSLPPEIFIHLLKHLTMPEIKAARLVCQKWKHFVDHEVPINVCVDDMQEGNCEFAQSVLKRTMTVNSLWKNWTRTTPPFFPSIKPHILEKMHVKGRIFPHFITHFIPKFLGLTELHIGGETLLRPMCINVDFLLPHLKKLSLNAAFTDETKMNLTLNSAQVFTAKNTLNFLDHVRCPNIQILILDGDVNQTSLPMQHNYAELLLSKFLKRYHKTLRKILIGESNILKVIDSPQAMRVYPIQLGALHFSFVGFHDQPLEEQAAWYRLIHSQQLLEYLNLGALWFPHVQMILNNLPITMKHLALYWNVDVHQELDFECFGKLVNLERLELTFDGNPKQKFTKVCRLKNCTKLKVLVTEQGIISTSELECLHIYCPMLEVLYLFRCGQPGLDWFLSESPDAPFGISRQALVNILTKIRPLEYLFVDVADFVGDRCTKLEMIDWIRSIAEHQVSAGFHIGEEPPVPDLYTIT